MLSLQNRINLHFESNHVYALIMPTVVTTAITKNKFHKELAPVVFVNADGTSRICAPPSVTRR